MYPHTLTYTVKFVPSDPQKDDNGDYIDQDIDLDRTVEIPCRFQINGSRERKGPDGTLSVYDFDAFMPKTDEKLKKGIMVTVKDQDGTVLGSGTVKGFKDGFFNSQIWV